MKVIKIMKVMKIISQYIAPWALSREDIPIHLMWDPSFSYDNIIVNIPADMVLKEFLNVNSYSRQGTLYIINELKTRNFFGLTVASSNVIKEQHMTRKINIAFVLHDEEVYSHDFIAHLYRPQVSLIECPESITITGETRPEKLLNITLKLSGFGKIQIRNEISTGGNFVERAEPLYRGIIRRMISTFRLDDVKVEDKGIKISPIYLQKKTKEYIEKIEKGVFPLDIEEEVLEEFRNWVMNESNRQKVMELISKHAESLLIDSLLFYFERYPAENVQMPQGKPVMYIERATRKVALRFRYRDAMLNEYNPINTVVNIDDKRKDRTRSMEIPINIIWVFEIVNPLEECK